MAALGSAIKGLTSGAKTLFKSNAGKSIVGGAATFFSFEWLTNGGLVNSVSGALGISNTASSILIIAILFGAIYLAYRFIESRLPAKRRSRR